MRVHLITALTGFLMASIPLTAADPPKDFQVITVRVDNSSTGRTFVDQEHDLFMPGPVRPGMGGEMEGHRLTLFTGYLKARGTASVQYPPLRAGDIIPMFGRLYRTGTPEYRSVVFTYLKPDEYPPGVTVAEKSFVVPITRAAVVDNHSNLEGNQLYAWQIDPPAGGKGAASATFEIWPPDGQLGEKDRILTATVKVGDILMLPIKSPLGKEAGHKVLAVIPPDPKTRVIGWVEFEPKALFKEDELAKDGGRLVRPVILVK